MSSAEGSVPGKVASPFFTVRTGARLSKSRGTPPQTRQTTRETPREQQQQQQQDVGSPVGLPLSKPVDRPPTRSFKQTTSSKAFSVAMALSRAGQRPIFGEQTESLVPPSTRLMEAKIMMEDIVRSKRRRVRLIAFAAVLALAYFVYHLFHFGSWRFEVVQRYDPRVGISLEVGGCDIDVLAGGEPEVRFSALLKGAAATWTKRSTDVSITEFAHLANRDGCADVPAASGCRRKCLVEIYVPPVAASMATFSIEQDPDDVDSPLVTITPGTTLHHLTIGSARNMPRSISLLVDGATLTGNLHAALGFGEARVVDSTLRLSDAVIDSSYSIYVLNVSNTGSALTFASSSSLGGCHVSRPTVTTSSSSPATAASESAAASASTTTASAASFAMSGARIQSTGGEVVVTQRGWAPPPRSHEAPPPRPQPRLLSSDAQRLSQLYGIKYGDRSSAGAGYLTIDVVGSAGVPEFRFVCEIPSRTGIPARAACPPLCDACASFISAAALLYSPLLHLISAPSAQT